MIKIKLTYFKPSGKYYSDGEYESSKDTFWDIITEVQNKLMTGDCPGLMDNSVMRNAFDTLVTINSDRMGVPHLISHVTLVRAPYKS